MVKKTKWLLLENFEEVENLLHKIIGHSNNKDVFF